MCHDPSALIRDVNHVPEVVEWFFVQKFPDLHDGGRQSTEGKLMSVDERAKEVETDFNEIDTDNDGFITVAELKKSMKDDPKVSEANIDAMVKWADENTDGKLTLAEYNKLVR
ncbi:EF-hand domain-containing protein [Actinokineospora sp.]|uniref:EF-hand domain-containing protein n=1 Tax=Actinokineospora sp. TaxID=1872133 RepID=UPI0040378076